MACQIKSTNVDVMLVACMMLLPLLKIVLYQAIFTFYIKSIHSYCITLYYILSNVLS